VSAVSAPTVTVVIRCRDEASHLAGVIDAALAQREAPAYEVLALDSGSTDGTLALLAGRPVRVAHLAPDAFTYGRALNRGAALARGALVVYLSAHCRPLSARWLAALVEPFADPAVVATFGRQVPVPAVNPIEAIGTTRNFPPAPPSAVPFSTANGALRRAAVLARPFDEDIAIAEDYLWACGVERSESIRYVPEAAVAHSHPMTFRHWHARFYAHGLAAAYARRRGLTLPWGSAGANAAHPALAGTRALARLAGHLARDRELRALAHLPAYALARTLSYARGAREGVRRYGGAGP
jgi:glycosyltransferase involved in cell wall biosynthesis